MKTTIRTTLVAMAMLAFSTFDAKRSTVFAQGTTGFTYQGRLNSGVNPANGFYDMIFALWDANVAGNRIAGPITNSAVAVGNGLFTVTLDFGAGVFTGTNYWVELTVRTNGAASFTMLVPRQQLTPAPYALSAAYSPPVGSVIAYMGTSAPAGWLLCDGRQVARADYASLFAVIGTISGAGDGTTTFNIPDLRGMFLRGVTGSRSDGFADPDATSRTATASGGNSGNNVGSVQADQYANHLHSVGINSADSYTMVAGGGAYRLPTYIGDGYSGGPQRQTGYNGGSETRPKNVYVTYIIKY